MNISGGGNPSPTIRECAKAIEAQMHIYADPRGGLVKILENTAHLWQELVNPSPANTTPRIFILCTGERAAGEYDGPQRTNMERVYRSWEVIVLRGHGFKALVADAQGQMGTPGYIEAFDDTIETIRDGIRILSNISAEPIVNYQGWRPLANLGPTPAANVFLDARVCEFKTAADIPSVASMTPA